MTAILLRGDARALIVPDRSVNLVICSPPYLDQRWYEDEGGKYDGQIGAEPTAEDYLWNLWLVMREVWRVLADDGSVFVNLGDKRSGSSAPGTTSGLTGRRAGGSPIPGQAQGKRTGITGGYKVKGFGRDKSKMLLPHRFAIGCEDGLADPCVLDHDHDDLRQCRGIGWIVRQDQVWDKPNGMPESSVDRTRDAHEYWFHLTKQGDYYQAVAEIREPSSDYNRTTAPRWRVPGQKPTGMLYTTNPTGKLPSSVWRIPTEPLVLPEYLVVDDRGSTLMDPPELFRYARHRVEVEGTERIEVRPLDHYAAFPTEWPRRLILGWSAPGICTACGKGRFPVVEKKSDNDAEDENPGIIGYACACTPYTDHPERRDRVDMSLAATQGQRANGPERNRLYKERLENPPPPVREYDFEGWTPPATTKAVVLDPFGGTGTTALVASVLGRVGISVDLSLDYVRIARWRIERSGAANKVRTRTDADRQGALFG